MQRRILLIAALLLTASFFYAEIPVSSSSMASTGGANYASYKPGEQISSAVFVLDKDLHKHKLSDIIRESGARVVMLYLYGGGAMNRPNKLGGIWCKDSFEDLYVLRFISSKYEEADVKIIPVACSPIYSTSNYDAPDRVFLDQADDSEAFKMAAQSFVESTEDVVFDGFVPEETYYDIRFRLLFNPRDDLLPGAGYGEVYDWQGKFRARNETQKYGTPTIWLLDSNGVVLQEPFHGNIYQDQELNYTVLEVDKAIQRHLNKK